MRFVTVFFSACLFVFTFFVFVADVHAAGQILRVMTFNTELNSLPQGVNDGSCPTEAHVSYSKAKVNAIAQYIKDNNIEVALLQEIKFRCNEKGTPSYNEAEGLSEALNGKGYPMHYVNVPLDVQLQTPIFSKYPIDTAAVRHYPFQVGGYTRSFIIAPIKTDVGTLTFYNLHTRNTEACKNLRQFMDQVNADNIPNKIIGGDFNVNLNRDLCGRNELTNYLYNLTGNYIDYIIVPKGGTFSFINSRVDTSASAPNSGHDPVISDIQINLPLVTPTPSPTPAGCQLQGLKRIENANAPVDSLIGKAKFRVGGAVKEESAAQPFFVQITQGTHTVTMENPDPNTYNIGYTVCTNRTDCHNTNPTMSNTVQVSCTDGYVDLWWHFVKKPTPTPSPSPTAKQGDLDRDNDVDIFDYNALLQNFGRTGVNGFHPADIIQNGKVDIFDFNALLGSFGN